MRCFLLTRRICQGFLKIAQRQHVSAPHCRQKKLQLATAGSGDSGSLQGSGLQAWGFPLQVPDVDQQTGKWAVTKPLCPLEQCTNPPRAQSASPGWHLSLQDCVCVKTIVSPLRVSDFIIIIDYHHFLYHLLIMAPVEPTFQTVSSAWNKLCIKTHSSISLQKEKLFKHSDSCMQIFNNIWYYSHLLIFKKKLLASKTLFWCHSL